MLATLLERLAEMFPGSDYQSRMENYIANRVQQADAYLRGHRYYY